MHVVSIQGYKGSFHHLAAELLLSSDLQIQERDQFEEVFEDLQNGRSSFGVVAISNTIFGEIKEVSALLKKHGNLRILKKVDLSIQQNLIVIPCTPLDKIKEVHSQLPALKQCQQFFANQPQLKQVETVDTALSVLEMMKENNQTIAAIGSSLAAKLYGAEILLPKIQDSSLNITSFILLRKETEI